jgi:hypothetical protein
MSIEEAPDMTGGDWNGSSATRPRKMLSASALAAVALMVSMSAFSASNGAPDGGSGAVRSPAEQGGPGTLKNAIELCERLAGVERQICLDRARDNREQAPPQIGATPGQSGRGDAGAATGPTPRRDERR